MHPVERPTVRRSEEYKRPEGDLDLRTSYAQQYTRTYPHLIFTTSPNVKKVKASHTRHRALGPELIPVYRQSACR